MWIYCMCLIIEGSSKWVLWKLDSSEHLNMLIDESFGNECTLNCTISLNTPFHSLAFTLHIKPSSAERF